jgi:uncharacterized membrane protein YvlD (DUF360 family)
LRHLINWLLSALAVWVVSRLIPGFHVTSVPAALIAALVIGLINATLGLVLKIVTFPLTILTLGIFWFVINALMLRLLGRNHSQPGQHDFSLACRHQPQRRVPRLTFSFPR